MIDDVLDLLAVGEIPTYQQPSLNPDLSVRMDALDGEVIGPIYARSLDDRYWNVQRGKWQSVNALDEVIVYCMCTESRFTYVCPKYDRGGGWVGFDPVGLAAATVANVVGVQPVPQTGFGNPEVLGDLRDRGIPATGNRDHVTAELLGMGLGHVNILPAAPTGTTDRLSPIRAAVPFLPVVCHEDGTTLS